MFTVKQIFLLFFTAVIFIILKENVLSMKKTLFLFCFFLFFLQIFAQSDNLQYREISFLLTKAQKEQGENLFETVLKIIDYYLEKDPDSARYWLNRNHILLNEIKNPKLKSVFFKDYSYFFIREADYKNAITFLKKAIEVEEKNGLKQELAESYRWLAGIYYEQGYFNQAIETVYKSLKVFSELKDYQGVVMCYSNIGLLENEIGNYGKAIKNYYKAVNIANKHKVKFDKSMVYLNLGIAFRYLKNYDSSYFYLLKASEVAKHKKDSEDLARIYLNFAKLFMEQNEKDSVKLYFELLLDLYPQLPASLKPTVLTTIGKWYYKQKNYKKALTFLKQSYELAKVSENLKEKEYSLFYLYKTMKDSGKYYEAIIYLEELTDVQDSIKRTEAKIKIEQLKKQFEYEKQQIRIEELEKSKKKDRIIKLLLFLILLLIIGVLVNILRVYGKQKKINRLERERMLEDLNFKNKQLTSQALLMMHKNKLLNNILQSLSKIKSNKEIDNKELNQLIFKVKSGLQTEKDWELFKQYFEMVNKDFFTKLKEKYPDLTQSELKLCALIKLRFNIKEAAMLLNISPNSVKTARHQLRKKFGLKRQENLYDFLAKF